MEPYEANQVRYETLEQLKFSLKNYVVVNGYPLQFTMSENYEVQVSVAKQRW